jgi:maltose-binding protein MalE
MIEDSAGNVPFYGRTAYAINADSAQKELAWDLLKFLTQDAQRSADTYVPVRQDEFWTNYVPKIKENLLKSVADPDPRIYDEAYVHSLFEQMEARLQMLNCYNEFDPFIEEIEREAVHDYNLGLINEQGLADRLQEKMTLYLNE